MFDWDRDQAEVVAPRSLPPPPAPPPPAPRAWQGQWLAPLVAPALGAMVWFTVFQTDEAPRVAVSAAAFGGAPAPVAAPADLLLVAYDAAAEARFRSGLGRFGDDDLIRFAQALHRDLGDLTGPLTPDLLDALALAEATMAARGLSVPPPQPTLTAARVRLAGTEAPEFRHQTAASRP
jgi:hypothetical protein